MTKRVKIGKVNVIVKLGKVNVKPEEVFFNSIHTNIKFLNFSQNLSAIESTLERNFRKIANISMNKLKEFFTKEKIDEFLDSRKHWKNQPFENYTKDDLKKLLLGVNKDYSNSLLTGKAFPFKNLIYIMGYLEFLKNKRIVK